MFPTIGLENVDQVLLAQAVLFHERPDESNSSQIMVTLGFGIPFLAPNKDAQYVQIVLLVSSQSAPVQQGVHSLMYVRETRCHQGPQSGLPDRPGPFHKGAAPSPT